MGSSLAYCDWNWTAAELEFKRGLALEPDDSSLLRSYSNFDWVISRTPEQLEFARRAVAHDPLNAWNFFHLSIAQGLSGQYDEAVASMQRAIELSPTSSGFHAILTNALLAAGKPALAMEEIQREPDKQARDMNWPFIYHALGQDRDADAAIEDFKKNFGARDPENVAAYYACRKQADLAIEWLKRTVAQGGLLTETANRRECYKNIEGDPRYQSILRGFNMPK
jgi:tetratricopeptide (TPR) repeat protein